MGQRGFAGAGCPGQDVTFEHLFSTVSAGHVVGAVTGSVSA
jgi:hypothetical protein